MCIIFIVIIMLMLINTTLTSYHQVGERLVPLPAFSVWQIYTDPLDCKSIVQRLVVVVDSGVVAVQPDGLECIWYGMTRQLTRKLTRQLTRQLTRKLTRQLTRQLTFRVDFVDYQYSSQEIISLTESHSTLRDNFVGSYFTLQTQQLINLQIYPQGFVRCQVVFYSTASPLSKIFNFTTKIYFSNAVTSLSQQYILKM